LYYWAFFGPGPGLWAAGGIVERRQTPQTRAENERKLLDSSFPWPRNGTETLAFAISMSLMTAAWESSTVASSCC
jgi:hypothetical protein